jgi:cobalt-zinc-cadmium efflux system outer membrane protein
MRIGRRAVAVCAALSLQAGAAHAQGTTLTLSEALAQARERAPEIVGAQLLEEEARGRLAGASLRFPSNPELEGAVGSRTGRDGQFTDLDVGLGQRFESGSRRTARVAMADAEIARSTAAADDTSRLVLRAAASGFFRVLHAQERIRLLEASGALAATVHSVADRRLQAGDIAVLDVNLARASLARVRAAREAAEADRALVVGDLKVLLGLEGDLRAEGTLSSGAEADLGSLLQTAAERPELRALAAGVREAEAEVSLGRAFATPDYGLGVRYSREGGDQIVFGGMTVSLPVFSNGQELRATGSARAARLRADFEASRVRVQMEVRTAHEAYARRLASVRVLETDVMPELDENDALTTRSFDVGQIGLPDLLLIRREILDARMQYLDALLLAALARVDLDASAGVLR